MPARIIHPVGRRKCCRCRRIKPADLENFSPDKRSPDGLTSECRPCRRKYKKQTDKRPTKFRSLSWEEREKHRIRTRAYYNGSGRGFWLIHSYRRWDTKAGRGCDLTPDFMREKIFGAPCTYCGTTAVPMGCDRVDNTLGHLMTNVVPACALCNSMRGHRFTSDEMRIIGTAVAAVRAAREAVGGTLVLKRGRPPGRAG